jgi:SAM-dependent methyltransferase
MKVCPDIICFPGSPEAYPDRWVLMNVFTRDCLGIGPEVIEFLSGAEISRKSTYRTWEIWRFSHKDGLLADPSRFCRDAGSWGEVSNMTGESLHELLKEKCILIEDKKKYRARFSPKKSLLDTENLGNYHEQLGQHLLTIERTSPSHWWLAQKFNSDRQEIRDDNLYGAVQKSFLMDWLPRKIKNGQKVLDLGCGPGVITKMIAQLGANVLGVDPNKDFIELAQKEPKGARFETRNLDSPNALADIPSHSLDIIFMSDALLFYFVPYQREKPLSVQSLVEEIRRVLKPSGIFLSLEPHPVFFLLPWLGDSDHPFTVVTEYLNAQWRINPPLQKLTTAFLKNGFMISDLEELSANPIFQKVDHKALAFAKEFPLWLALEFRLFCNR